LAVAGEVPLICCIGVLNRGHFAARPARGSPGQDRGGREAYIRLVREPIQRGSTGCWSSSPRAPGRYVTSGTDTLSSHPDHAV